MVHVFKDQIKGTLKSKSKVNVCQIINDHWRGAHPLSWSFRPASTEDEGPARRIWSSRCWSSRCRLFTFAQVLPFCSECFCKQSFPRVPGVEPGLSGLCTCVLTTTRHRQTHYGLCNILSSARRLPLKQGSTRLLFQANMATPTDTIKTNTHTDLKRRKGK